MFDEMCDWAYVRINFMNWSGILVNLNTDVQMDEDRNFK